MIKLYNHALSRDDLRALTHYTDEYNTMETGDYRFWNFAKDKPRNGIEAALLKLWRKVGVDAYRYQDGGIEYWLNKSNGVVNSQWHQDLVEKDSEGTTRYVPGEMSMVFYPYVFGLQGGYLELADYEACSTKHDFRTHLRKLDPANVERIKPRTNLAVCYKASRMHRVAPIYGGARHALASTLWLERPPAFKNSDIEDSKVDKN